MLTVSTTPRSAHRSVSRDTPPTDPAALRALAAERRYLTGKNTCPIRDRVNPLPE